MSSRNRRIPITPAALTSLSGSSLGKLNVIGGMVSTPRRIRGGTSLLGILRLRKPVRFAQDDNP